MMDDATGAPTGSAALTTDSRTEGEKGSEARKGQSLLVKGSDEAKAFAQLGVQARRKKAAERAAAAADRGATFRQRIGLALAQLSQEDLNAAVRRMMHEAQGGDSRGITALARLADQSFGRAKEEAQEADRPYEELTYQEMTPAQRATYRAALLHEYAQARAEAEAAEDSSDPRSAGETEGSV